MKVVLVVICLSLSLNVSALGNAGGKVKQLGDKIVQTGSTLMISLVVSCLMSGCEVGQQLGPSIINDEEGRVKSPTVKLIAPAFNVPREDYYDRVEEMITRGYVFSSSLPADISIESRLNALIVALTDPDCENLLCVRGGYGTSDLLPYLPYDDLKSGKRLIGYSDISALHSALWTKNGHIGIYGAMIATNTWGDLDNEDMQILLGIMAGEVTSGGIDVRQLLQPEQTAQQLLPIEGLLYGGNISVLTNLIDTPYMPDSLNGYILFFEDIGENVFRLIRYLNQWQQSNMLDGVQAIVLGHFEKLIGEPSDLYKEFSARINFPIYISEDFGHRQPFYPLPVGGQATITDGKLNWKIPD